MTPWLDDGDIRLYHGDALETVRELPDESVDCVVTSPPYWGLRDYGTGEWDGGDPDCDHIAAPHSSMRPERSRATSATFHGSMSTNHGDSAGTPYRKTCGQCGARRVDQQMGLEETPDLFVANMVELFREIRRVLTPHGTCWVNLGDSYNAHPGGNGDRGGRSLNATQGTGEQPQYVKGHGLSKVKTLKPKDLVGIPWRVAFALQADGWWLRADIIWSKPNPMPESVTDRPTKAHEYLFLLTKQPRYWFDAEAIREDYAPKTLTHRGGGKAAGKAGNQDENGKVASGNFGDWDKPRTAHPRPRPQEETLDGSDGEAPRGPDGRRNTHVEARDGSIQHRDGERWPNAGRNVRSVWTIATQPYPEAHFATYPEELARRCILAGCPVRVCRVCGKPSERIVEREFVKTRGNAGPNRAEDPTGYDKGANMPHPLGYGRYDVTTTGWSDCGCAEGTPVNEGSANGGGGSLSASKWRPGVVLDPFIGSGTTAKVARDHQRHAIGIDLNEQYLDLAARRLQQLSLLNDSAA